jgi:hypothetical protein
VKRPHFFRIILPLALIAAFGSARAAETVVTKPLAGLFPSLTTIDSSALYDLSSTAYKDFVKCQVSTNKAVDCPAVALGPGMFFRFSNSPTVDDSYDYVNRCVSVRTTARVLKGAITLAGGNVSCSVGDEEVVEAQLVACYTRPNGTFCSLAVACFAGPKALGECTKDYVAEEVSVPRNISVASAPPSPVPSGGPVKCIASWCLNTRARSATCYMDGTFVSYTPGPPGSCSGPEYLGPVPCNDPTYCTAGPGPSPTPLPALAANDWCFYGGAFAFGLPSCSRCTDGGTAESTGPSLACPNASPGVHVTRCGPVSQPISGASPCAAPGAPAGCANAGIACTAY